MDDSRYKRAIVRNLHEVHRALLNRTTLHTLEEAGPFSATFLKIIYCALFNDYIAHLIKVLEKKRNTASFWYVYQTDKKVVNEYARKEGLNLSKLEALAKNLTQIRNKTHFHIDKERVFDPKNVWQEAGITGRELSEVADILWKVLDHLHVLKGGEEFVLSDYDGYEVTVVARMIESGEIPSHP